MANTSSAKRQAGAAIKRAEDEAAAGVETATAEAKASTRRVKAEAGEIEESIVRGAEDLAATVSEKLRSVGVDTDRMTDVAKEQVGELQQLIEKEIRERPLRALGLAAAVGLFVGFLAAR